VVRGHGGNNEMVRGHGGNNEMVGGVTAVTVR
jgi:hypothetical protein